MFAKRLICVLARAFAKIGIDGDVSADQCLQGCADVPNDAARTNDDAADQAEVFCHAITVKVKAVVLRRGSLMRVQLPQAQKKGDDNTIVRAIVCDSKEKCRKSRPAKSW